MVGLAGAVVEPATGLAGGFAPGRPVPAAKGSAAWQMNRPRCLAESGRQANFVGGLPVRRLGECRGGNGNVARSKLRQGRRLLVNPERAGRRSHRLRRQARFDEARGTAHDHGRRIGQWPGGSTATKHGSVRTSTLAVPSQRLSHLTAHDVVLSEVGAGSPVVFGT